MSEQMKTALVTGAGSGVGRAVALALAQDGYRVIGTGRSESTLKETAELDQSGRFSWRIQDVANAEQTDKLVASLLQEFGAIDILFNNAAVYPVEWFLDQTSEQWNQVIAINVMGPANCIRAVLPGMLEQGYGRIISMGSYADRKPITTSSAYSVSKGAMHALTKAVAAEINPATHANVLINELIPGAVNTSMSGFTGRQPKEIYPWVKQIIDLPVGGYSGQTLNQGRWEVPQPGLKQKIKKKLKFWKR